MDGWFRYCFCIAFIVRICVNICHVGIKILAINSELGGIKYIDFLVYKLLFDLLDLFSCAGGCDLLVDFGQKDRTGADISGPVRLKLFTCSNCSDSILIIGLPVDPGRNNKGIRAC